MKTTKTFLDLKIGDEIFWCSPNDYTYQKKSVTLLRAGEFKTGISNGGSGEFIIDGKDLKYGRVEKYGYHHFEAIIFTEESECIRYCKTNLLKGLAGKIEKAKKAIEEVNEFRKINFDRLNDWTELEITRLNDIRRAL